MNPVTSVGFGCADPLAGLARLFALFARRFASAALRLARLRAILHFFSMAQARHDAPGTIIDPSDYERLLRPTFSRKPRDLRYLYPRDLR